MGKAKVKPNLYLLLHSGYSAKDLIKLGYSKPTVYTYSLRYKLSLQSFSEDLMRAAKLGIQPQQKQSL